MLVSPRGKHAAPSKLDRWVYRSPRRKKRKLGARVDFVMLGLNVALFAVRTAMCVRDCVNRVRIHLPASRIGAAALAGLCIISFTASFSAVTAIAMTGSAGEEQVSVQIYLTADAREDEVGTEVFEPVIPDYVLPVTTGVDVSKAEDFSVLMQHAAQAAGVDATKQWKRYAELSDTMKLLFHETAAEYGVNEAYILGICYNESRFNPGAINATNTDGTTDWGIGQCNDCTFPTLKKLIGISSIRDVLEAETGIRACCALFDYYKDMGFADEDALLAYQEGLGNYKNVKEGREQPWAAYGKVLENAEVYAAALKYLQ